MGPQLWISTVGGNVLLTWDEDRLEYNEDPDLRVYKLSYSDSESRWTFSAVGVDWDFNNNPTCKDADNWPPNYGFISVTGPPIDYEILRFQHQEDEYGRYHHTRVEVEAEDHDSRRGQ